MGRTGSKKERKHMQKQMNILMQWVVAELLKIEETLAHELNTNKNGRSKGGKNRRHGWSDVFHRKVGISYLIESTIKCCTQKKKRPQVRTLIQQIIRHSKAVSMDLQMEIEEVPEVTDSKYCWKQYEKKSRTALKKLRKGTHLRMRAKWRNEMKKFKHRRDEQRKNSQEVKAFLDYALKRFRQNRKPDVLLQERDDGMHIIEGKQEIHNIEREVTAKPMGRGRKKWFIVTRKGKRTLHTGFGDTKKERQWRRRIQTGAASAADFARIPPE